MEMYTAQINTMKQEIELISLENKLRELKVEATVIEKQREAFVAEWQANVAQELLKNRQELANLQEEIKKARHLNQLVELRVPDQYETKEFVVFEVADRSIGSVLKSGEPLFKLIPLDVPLEVEIQIDGRDIGRVRPIGQRPTAGDFPAGSEVKIKLNAFNYQQHGTLSGFLRTVSEGSQERDSKNGLPPQVSYRGIVELIEPIKLIDLSDNQRLMPGMTATAEIKVGRRRVIDYLLYPLFRYLDSSLHEP
jgi:HlyD family secretion protein